MKRIIYSLVYTIDLAGPQTVAWVIPLDRNGQSSKVWPIGKRRVIDLRVGDCFRRRDDARRYRIRSIRAFRDVIADDDYYPAEPECFILENYQPKSTVNQ